MKKAFRIVGKVLLALVVAILLLLAVSIAPIDRTLPTNKPFYNTMMQRIDSLDTKPMDDSTAGFKIGFGKASITPAYPTSTAGYVKRRGAHFTAIHDSIFVRTMVVMQGEKKVALVSLDMLIVPPLLYDRLMNELQSIKFSIDQVYLGATHTHNSIGQWDDHLVGEVYAGEYDPGLIEFITNQVLESIQIAERDIQIAEVKHGSVPVREAVNNRLIKNGPVDSLLHIIEVQREDGTKGIFTSFSAHATCISSKDLDLSRDYPGALVDRFEENGYTFAMFMAGAVGSHAPISMSDGDEKIKAMSSMLFNAAVRADLELTKSQSLFFHRVPLALAKQQVKILPNWRAREWLSLRVMGEFVPSLTVLQLGNIVLAGTPCDFSGMLTEPIYVAAHQHDRHVMVTSFNGGYIGYITPDEYYDLDKYETQTMNWYGPGNGEYLQSCIIQLVNK